MAVAAGKVPVFVVEPASFCLRLGSCCGDGCGRLSFLFFGLGVVLLDAFDAFQDAFSAFVDFVLAMVEIGDAGEFVRLKSKQGNQQNLDINCSETPLHGTISTKMHDSLQRNATAWCNFY